MSNIIIAKGASVCICYLSAEDFSFGQLHVSRQLLDSDAQRLQSLTEVISHLSSQGLHRSYVYNL